MNAAAMGMYREFFAAIAATAGALTGLLFVAMSVAPRRGPEDGQTVIQQIRAAAALLAFVNALAVSLFALVPGNTARYPAVFLGIGGILFTAAGIRTIVSSPQTAGRRLRQLGLISLLLLIFGTELVAGLILVVHPDRVTPVEYISNALVASLLLGIARAWELVGDRDTGVLASIAVLAHRSQKRQRRVAVPAAGAAAADAAPTADAGSDGPAPGPDSQETREPGESPPPPAAGG